MWMYLFTALAIIIFVLMLYACLVVSARYDDAENNYLMEEWRNEYRTKD